MADNKPGLWKEEESIGFYKWPFYEIGVQLQPEVALNDVLNDFASLMLEKQSAGRTLARLIDQGAKAGISVTLHIEDVDAALEELPENHRLRAAVSSMVREGLISVGVKKPAVAYSKQGLRRLFGLS